jgi:hypothetical protein
LDPSGAFALRLDENDWFVWITQGDDVVWCYVPADLGDQDLELQLAPMPSAAVRIVDKQGRPAKHRVSVRGGSHDWNATNASHENQFLIAMQHELAVERSSWLRPEALDDEGRLHYPLLPLPGISVRTVVVIDGFDFPVTLRPDEVAEIVF